jgi:hypothetical protein
LLTDEPVKRTRPVDHQQEWAACSIEETSSLEALYAASSVVNDEAVRRAPRGNRDSLRPVVIMTGTSLRVSAF